MNENQSACVKALESLFNPSTKLEKRAADLVIVFLSLCVFSQETNAAVEAAGAEPTSRLLRVLNSIKS